MHISSENFFKMVAGQTLQLPLNIKSQMAFRLTYLDLTFVHSKVNLAVGTLSRKIF